MALVNTSQYQVPVRSLLREGLDGYDRAMQSNAAAAQRRDADAKRKQAEEEARQNAGFERALRGLTQINDPQTPEGRTGLVRDLNRLGYGKHAMGLMGNFQEMFPEAKPTQKSYQTIETDQGYQSFDPQTAKVAPLAGANGQPLRKPQAPKDPPVGKFQLVKNRKGQMVSVDVTTGLGRDGNPVDAWTDPVKPEKGLTAANTVGILERVARRMDDDPALKIVERRDNFYQTAKTAYDQYMQAPSEIKGEARRQADQQLLFSLAKMRDEGVVMPGEFVRETQGQGWLTGALNKVASGVTSGLNLDDSQRKYILDLMGKFKSDAVKRAKPRYEFYKKQGEKYGDSEMVSGAWDPYFAETAPASPAAPPADTGWTPAEESRYQELLKKASK